jgi:hypothetical protein
LVLENDLNNLKLKTRPIVSGLYETDGSVSSPIPELFYGTSFDSYIPELFHGTSFGSNIPELFTEPVLAVIFLRFFTELILIVIFLRFFTEPMLTTCTHTSAFWTEPVLMDIHTWAVFDVSGYSIMFHKFVLNFPSLKRFHVSSTLRKKIR